MSKTMVDQYKSHACQVILTAIHNSDWVAYANNIHNYPVILGFYHLISSAVSQRCSDDHQLLKILKDLLTRCDFIVINSMARYDLLRSACLFANIAAIKVLLAAGCEVSLRLLFEILGFCGNGVVDRSQYIEVLLLLLDHCQLDLSWVFLQGEDIDTDTDPGYDLDFCHGVISLDDTRVSRAILLNSLNSLVDERSSCYDVITSIDHHKAVNTAKMLIQVGLIEENWL